MLSRPNSVAEAAELIRLGARPLGGGTVIIPTLRPDEHVVYLRSVAELREIRHEGSNWVVGAAVTLGELRARLPVATALGDALAWIGTPAVRNVATIGGNVGPAAPADLLAVLHACGTVVEVLAGSARRTVDVPTALGFDGLIVRFRVPDGLSAALRLAPRDHSVPSLLVAAVGPGGPQVAIARRIIAPDKIKDPYLAHAASVLSRRAADLASQR